MLARARSMESMADYSSLRSAWVVKKGNFQCWRLRKPVGRCTCLYVFMHSLCAGLGHT